MPPASSGAAAARVWRRGALAGVVLLALTTAVYWPAREFGFAHYDDRPYVEWNPHVRSGLSRENAAWAFTTLHQANWHPLTWISHMLDVEVHGLDPGGHHLTNVVLHLANTVLLLALFTAMTGALWRSTLLAALFAVHPLHVESVAWIAERKDVLSTFLLLATLGAYLRHARRPGPGRLVAVALLFALGLLAKPMLVTLPCALLLLDWWPLARAGCPAQRQRPEAAARRWRALAFEKLPLFALAASVSAVTLVAQRRGGAMQALAAVPAGQRAANAAVAYGAYLLKTAWPAGLAPMYPFPSGGPAPWKVVTSLAALAAASWAVVRWRSLRPAAATGWLWYLGTLVPVIGIVPVGSQALADRYTYVPLIGIFMALVWALGDATRGRRRAGAVAGVAACVLVAALALAAREQLGHWRDGQTLERRTLAVAGDAWSARMQKAAKHEAHKELAEAEAAYRGALEIRPGQPTALNNLGLVLSLRGRPEEGLSLVREAIRARPDYAEAHYNLGVLLSNRARFTEAAGALRQALRLKPDFPEARDLLRKLEGEPLLPLATGGASRATPRAGVAPPASP